MKTTLDDMLATGRDGDETPGTVGENSNDDLQAIASVLKALEPGEVFGAPVVSGGYTIITASEYSSAAGFGSSRGTVPIKLANANNEDAPVTRNGPVMSSWRGGGGGGGSQGRPIAFIVMGPDGVRVEPVVDVTKFLLAFIAMWRAVLPGLLKLATVRKARKA